MSELFAEPGQSSNITVSPPSLKGLFVPGIDVPQMADGLGLYTPWGGGSTNRSYLPYGPGEGSPQATQLRDLSNALFTPSTKSATYNLSGLVGPQGPQGPPGAPGSVTVISLPLGSADLSSTIQQIQALGYNPDTILYGAADHIEWNETWVPMPVADIKSWNGVALNTDGSFMLIASNVGLYVTTNTGGSWTQRQPSTAAFLGGDVSNASGNAAAWDDKGRDYGKFWTSSDYGVTWNEVVLSTVS